jgi:hypothetical protein
MKIRRPILWLCVVVLMLLLLIVRQSELPSKLSLTALNDTNSSSPLVERISAQPSRHAGETATATNPRAATTNIVPPTQTKDQRRLEGLANLNDEEIVLYGRVIDQSGSPVSDANVAGTIQVNNGIREGSDKISLSTDANGLFTITGYKGKGLGIMIKKTGYALATKDTTFVYSHLWPEAERHVPDANNPVVFKMWKLQGAEPLVTIDQRYKVPYTSSALYFDLVNGKAVQAGGDIKITVSRPPGIVSQNNPQNWSVQVEAVDGGLIETSMAEARVTYVAPDNGYQPSDGLLMSITNHWSDLVQQMYFVTSRNGQVFSKIFLSTGVNANPGDPMSVTFRGVANANRSRNWEGDPNTMQSVEP